MLILHVQLTDDLHANQNMSNGRGWNYPKPAAWVQFHKACNHQKLAKHILFISKSLPAKITVSVHWVTDPSLTILLSKDIFQAVTPAKQLYEIEAR